MWHCQSPGVGAKRDAVDPRNLDEKSSRVSLIVQEVAYHNGRSIWADLECNLESVRDSSNRLVVACVSLSTLPQILSMLHAKG